MAKQIIDKLQLTWQRLRADERGNVAILFGLALIPLFGLAGAAVDYSRAVAARTSMQSALDSTALMLARDVQGSSTLSQTDRENKARAYFNELFHKSRPDAVNDPVQVTYTGNSGNFSLKLDVTARLDTQMIRVVPQLKDLTQISFKTSSTISWGQNRLRVALALDNTGSMSDASKMDNLKTATKNLLTQLKNNSSTNGDVYVSLIPFSKDVNVGKSNVSATWIDWTTWDATHVANGDGIINLGNNRYCYQGQMWQWNGGWSFTYLGTCSQSARSGWDGCVTDRGLSGAPGVAVGYDQKVDLPIAGTLATLFLAEDYDDCPVEMMGMSYDWTALNSKVDSMQPKGNTNQGIGLVWAWQSLVGGGPLTVPAKDPTFQYDDILILFSDGLNTQNRWYDNAASIDARMCTSISNGKCTGGTCKNIQDAKITVYAVQVSTSGDPQSNLMKACATDTEKFFYLTSANQIVTTFQKIGTEVSRLRIAK